MKKTFKIGNNIISENQRVFIIAEAGVNHNGRLDMTLALVKAAAEAGADAVKFQTYKAEDVVTDKGEMASYQKANMGYERTQREMLESLELPETFYEPIINRCEEKNILFLSTPHGGKRSVDLLESYDMCAYKISSADLTNYLLLEKVAKIGKPVILSTGMATMKEVQETIFFVKKCGNNKIAVLHCTTEYPCPPEDVNLASMISMMKTFNVPVGYSDHSQGSQVAIMAVTLGAAIYECHLTLDKTLSGPDHKASNNPVEFKSKVDHIRKVNLILGSSVKKPTRNESLSMIKTVRKSIVAVSDLRKGHILKIEDIEAKRPYNGISPELYMRLMGKKLNKNISKDEPILLGDII